MTPEIPHLIDTPISLPYNTEKDPSTTSIISAYVIKVIEYINAYVLGILIAVVGIFTNTADISVYWKMGLSETTNISFYPLSIFDLMVSTCAVKVQITNNRPVSVMELPSRVPVSELGIAVDHLMYPGLGCKCLDHCRSLLGKVP